MITPNQWLIIAEAYLTPYDERTAIQRIDTDFGICASVEEVSGREWHDVDNFKVKVQKLHSPYWTPYRDSEVDGGGIYTGIHRWGNGFKPIHDIYRGMFCLFMKEYCEDNKNA